MRSHVAALVVLSLAVGCGGASESDDNEGRVGAQDDDDGNNADAGAGASDDDTGESDDDQASDDDAPSDDDEQPDDEPSDDDAPPGDDEPPTPATPTGTPPQVTPVPPGTPVPSMVPVVPPPAEGCTLVSQSSSTTSCEVREQCSNAYKYTYCTQLTSGGWSCSCSDGFSSHELEVDTADSPCTQVSETCGSIEAPAFTGEMTCALEYQNTSVDYCEISNRCSEAVPVDDVISVVQSQYYYTSCYSDGAGGLSCNCSGLGGSKSFTLTGGSTATACTESAALCDSEVAPEPINEETCAVTYENTGTGYCNRQETCSQAVIVGDGEANITESRSGSCSTDAATGVTSCSCYNNSRSYSFEASTPADDPTSCASAIAVCDYEGEPVPEGPIECTVSSQSASGSTCSAYTTCTQDAAVGDVVIGLYGAISTSCSPNGDAFTCQCATGLASVSLDVAAEDAWSACTDAAAQCPDLVDVEVGSSGGGIVMPPCSVPMAPASPGMASGGSPAAEVVIPCKR